MIVQPAPLNDTLHNMHYRSGADSAYARGVLVGVIGTLLAVGMDFDRAIHLASISAPNKIVPNSVPESWRPQFGLPPERCTEGSAYWLRSEGKPS